jgi:hypothetical protein
MNGYSICNNVSSGTQKRARIKAFLQEHQQRSFTKMIDMASDFFPKWNKSHDVFTNNTAYKSFLLKKAH